MAASCAVCHDILGSGDKSCAAKCGHVLHNSCWEQWLKRRPECPECRTSTRREDLIILFFNKAESNNVSANDIDTLSSDIQNLNVSATLKRVNGVQPDIDLDDDDQDSYYSNESGPEVVTLEDSESDDDDESYLGSEEGDGSGTSSDSENDDSIPAEGVSLSGGTGSEDSPSDDSERVESDHNGSTGSSDDETGSEGSSDEEDSASDRFLSDESGRREDESDSYKTGSELENDSSTASTDETTDED